MPDDVIQWKLYTIFCRTQETLATNLAYDKASKSAPTRKCRREGRVTKSSDTETSIRFEHMESWKLKIIFHTCCLRCCSSISSIWDEKITTYINRGNGFNAINMRLIIGLKSRVRYNLPRLLSLFLVATPARAICCSSEEKKSRWLIMVSTDNAFQNSLHFSEKNKTFPWPWKNV